MAKYEKIIKGLRLFRIFHRYLGVTLAALLLISALTGILLSLKKDIDIIQPPTQKGTKAQLADWKPLQDLSQIAQDALISQYPEQIANSVDRLDVRPSKGIVKVLFEKGYWEVQVDGTSGEVLSIAKRHSDWIEALHDGSIISDLFKLISMNFLGFGVICLLLTGLWLWYGPKRLRRLKRRRTKTNQP